LTDVNRQCLSVAVETWNVSLGTKIHHVHEHDCENPYDVFHVDDMMLSDVCEGRESGDVCVGKESGDACVGRESGDVCVGRESGDVCVGKESGDACVGRESGDVCVGRESGDVCVGKESGDAFQMIWRAEERKKQEQQLPEATPTNVP
jgi:hypothetical protein